MAKFSLGDEVLVYHPSYRNGEAGSITRARIVKEGRRYVFLDPDAGWRLGEKPFDKETGRMKTGNDYYDPVLWVPAEWEAKERRNDVLAKLREAGVTFTRNHLVGAPVEFSTERLEKILAVIQEPDTTREGDTL